MPPVSMIQVLPGNSDHPQILSKSQGVGSASPVWFVYPSQYNSVESPFSSFSLTAAQTKDPGLEQSIQEQEPGGNWAFHMACLLGPSPWSPSQGKCPTPQLSPLALEFWTSLGSEWPSPGILPALLLVTLPWAWVWVGSISVNPNLLWKSHTNQTQSLIKENQQINNNQWVEHIW